MFSVNRDMKCNLWALLLNKGLLPDVHRSQNNNIGFEEKETFYYSWVNLWGDRKCCSNLSPWSGVQTSLKEEWGGMRLCWQGKFWLVGLEYVHLWYRVKGQEKARRNSSLAGIDGSVLCLSVFGLGTRSSLLKGLLLVKGSGWPHFCCLSSVDWWFLALKSPWGQGWHMLSAVSIK